MILLLALGCSPQLCQANGVGLDDTWSVSWRAPQCSPTVEATVVEIVTGVERDLGIWSDTSELHRIRDGVGRVPVSETTYGLVRVALDVAAATEGAFDPTIEPILRAWGLHTDTPQRPSDEGLAVAVAQVGWDRVEFGRGPSGEPWVDGHGTALDLSGLLEGHVADRVAARLGYEGIGNLLVTVGDEHRASGEGPAGPWRVGIDVEAGEPGAELVVALVGGGMASAGGQKVFDARSGLRVQTDVVRAVVLAPTATEADALATAWVALGYERGLVRMEARPDVEGLVYLAAGAGMRRTSSMP